uniref:Uncharacterized protein n=1 Tax=Arundo donax TaxID=35708 RepID=A0A0A9F8X7_ARUDO
MTYGSNNLPSFSHRHSNPSKAPSRDFADILSSKPCRNVAAIPYFFKEEIPNPLTTPARPKAAPRRSPYFSHFIIRSKSLDIRACASSFLETISGDKQSETAR